jgi:riboflavin kinase / FMN adenylyltransferase
MAENNPEGKSSIKETWITIGSFDGVHIGHQELIKSLLEGSKRKGCNSIVVSFFPNPIVHLKDIEDPFYLTLPVEKDRILTKLGIDSVLTISFDHTVSRLSPKNFISILHARLKFTNLLIGYDFRLGADRTGGFSALEKIGQEMGFGVQKIKPLMLESQPVSSSRIRAAITNGKLVTANTMLGYPYSITGHVIHGDGRGRNIGLPTANISIWKEKLLPKNGVYAAYAKLGEEKHPTVISIGLRPTFYDAPIERTIEAHILNFSEQIYNKNLTIEFISRLRDEIKYESVAALMEQVKKDIIKTKEILKSEPTQENLPS